ncbi:alpha-tocopherol transfer protein-like [Anopheles arabiensis]|uniref:AGAP003733-PA n=5 Tax=gambiae species complex TaxID=44542 RepID=Q7QG16_ANOGA|nr:alpha-tocopherol transfer protein-like [Anopheles arabiensis]XP_040174772.1 alpha-tocopherol transfer protein-like [Anopheles arabiensis]XP_040174782.1 alpha-tocopherol transfer protein-like [Anopheles arabiensis]XP_040225590.1 alpha-tocopherol transfer protein-like [Anopheles coluzzii]XP_040225592.1 alpha-tocopherol transfer protein-like [Anopheles coluzzii]XP_061501070.1 alpha-tocopherol transfer protein-like isoform X2 [Anopheles gambiae]XP_310264.7 alpha-tocopherol transfer protein-lik
MEHDLGYDLAEALEREDLSREDLKALRQPPVEGVPATITDKQLACFLDACDKNIDETRKVLKIYYEARKNGPELFNNRDPHSAAIQQCLQNQDYFPLPPTPSGYSVVFHRLKNSRSSNYHFDEAIKTYFMTIDSCLYTQGPRPGIIFLFDMKNVGLMHLTRINMSSVRKFFHYLQDGLPAKLKAIHVMNVVSFFDKILYIIKPFIHAEILNVLYLHTSSANLDSFYEEWIPKSGLPSDLGGDMKSIDELHQDHLKEFERLRPYFLAEERQRNGEAGNLIDEPTDRMLKSLSID